MNQTRRLSIKKSLPMTDAILSYQKILQLEKDEGVNKKKEDFSKKFDTAVLVFAGDWHIGVPNFDMANAIATIEYVMNTPNAMMFCLGDMLNTAILGAISDNFEDSVYPQEQWTIFLDMLTPVALAGKLTVIHEGNHERRTDKQTGINMMYQSARALETYNNRGEWQPISKISAPYYSERKIALHNANCKNGKFEITTMMHHGDGISNINKVKQLTEMNALSDLNVIGHLHKYIIKSRTIKPTTEDGITYRHRALDMILPANGDGYYGYMKMMGKKYNGASVALEATSVLNPLYDENSTARVKEPKYITAFREVPINANERAKKQAELVASASKVIYQKKKEMEAELRQKLQETETLLEKYGLELTKGVADIWDEKMGKVSYKPSEKKAIIKQENKQKEAEK